uniref:Uncharacterized protein n=1 Tax=Pararge aegeria TaxID=116150 RepID=S4P568_9NEOP
MFSIEKDSTIFILQFLYNRISAITLYLKRLDVESAKMVRFKKVASRHEQKTREICVYKSASQYNKRPKLGC